MAHESRLGPPSELINISEFIQQCSGLSFQLPQNLPEDARSAIEQECSVEDLKVPLSDILNNPRLAAYVLQTHEQTVNVIHESADTSTKRKRKRFNLPEPAEEHPEITALRRKLDGIKLECWPLTLDAALFMRGPKYTDQNPFTEPKAAAEPVGTSSTIQEALVTVTIYSRPPYKPGSLAKNSQHALLSSQSLGDLFETIPCTSNEIPKETYDGDEMLGYELGENTTPAESVGCVICIEGLAYGDGQSEEDYADKLLKHLKAADPDERLGLEKATETIHQTKISSLTVRLNQPYWLLHQGNCEHFIVFDQIRLVHPSDPRTGYPLTLQTTPPLLDICRGCTRVPAVWSIVGDIRLGESPCILCDPCWKNMGEPAEGGILVAPLPKHELGW